MRNSVSALALLGVFTAVPALAQDGEPVNLGSIVLEARTGDENEVEVSSEDIRRIGPIDLQDLFKGEPTVQVGSSIPLSQKVYVNGVEENNLAVTIDGARQNNKVFHHSTTNRVDPELLKAVRVDPGVAPADAGPGALGGALAYETRDVEDMLLPDDNFGGFVKSGIDSNGGTLSTSGALFGRQGGLEAMAYLKYADGGLREDGSGDKIIGSGTGLLSGLAKVAYEAPEGHRIELSYDHIKDDEARPYRANIGRTLVGRPVPLTQNYDLERRNIVLTYTNEKPAGLWDPTARLAYSVTDLTTRNDDAVDYGTTDSFNGEISNRFAVTSGSINVGLDFYKDRADQDYRDLVNPVNNEAGSESTRNIGIFAQARLEPLAGLRLSFGSRYDWQEFRAMDGETHDFSGLSGNVSAEYDVNEVVTVAGGYSHVFGGVPLAENFIMNPGWAGYAGNLETGSADNFFAAVSADWNGWNVKGKVFQTYMNDVRVASYRDPLQNSDLNSKGYELSAGYDWRRGFVHVAYANMDNELDGQPANSFLGNYLTMPLGEIISIEAAHEIAGTGLTFGGDAQFAMKNSDTLHDEAGKTPKSLPAYQVYNAFLEYTPRRAEGVTIRGEINNIFDETYFSRATYGGEYAGVEADPLNELGRNFRVTATLNF